MELGFPMESTVAVRKVSMDPTTVMSACNNALTLYDERFMARYLEDCKNDPDLQSFDKNMENRTKALIEKVKNDGGLSLEVCDEVVTTMSDLVEGTAKAVKNYKSQMIGMKNDSYQGVLKEYLDGSWEILNFCNDMEKFVDEARETHSFIEGKMSFIEGEIQNCSMNLAEARKEAMEISSTLKGNNCTAQILCKRVYLMLEKQDKLFKLVTGLPTNQKSVSFGKKLISYLFISVKVLGVSLAAIAAILPAITGMFSAVTQIYHWSCSLFKGSQDALNSMRQESLHRVRDMEEIQVAIDGIVNEMDALIMMSTKVANGTTVSAKINNFKHKLQKFSKKLDDLEEKTDECSSRTKKARKMLF